MTEHTILNGELYKNLIFNAINYLDQFRTTLNELNVFPIPDGDTGTNMVLTMQNGYQAIKNDEVSSLSKLAKLFSENVVLGARGNSGVIVSEFMGAFSESFIGMEEAGCSDFIRALENGVKKAYNSVANPVEGTMLTVIRESTEFTREEFEKNNIKTLEDLVQSFIKQAKISLENTPNLLPILKRAGVVDSGGAGVLYLFEGIFKVLNGERFEMLEGGGHEAPKLDFSKFNETSNFPFGYCTEFLIQLQENKTNIDKFDVNLLSSNLSSLGDSVIVIHKDNKVKVHVHTFEPERAISLCHQYGEFLTMKIENMSVQHNNLDSDLIIAKVDEKMVTSSKEQDIAIVAVCENEKIKGMFESLGADYVIVSQNASSGDFVNAYNCLNAKNIIVFPNDKGNVMPAEQSLSLYKKSKMFVLSSRSVAECYAALTMLNKDDGIEKVVETLSKTINNVLSFTISPATKDTLFDGKNISKGDFVSFSNGKLLSCEKTLLDASKKIIAMAIDDEGKEIVTLYTNKNTKHEFIKAIEDYIAENFMFVEFDYIATEIDSDKIILAFE